MKKRKKVIPLTNLNNGAWLEPKVACKYFKNGKGIEPATLMNKIYAGSLNGKVKSDHTGWYVFISNEALQQKENKEAA